MITWLFLLEGRLGSASDGGIQLREVATVDPLKKAIHARFTNPIPGKQAWVAFQIIVYAFAAANNCAVNRIKKVTDELYIIEVLIKDIHRSSLLDPFVDNWKSNRQKNKEAFYKFLREKTEELERDDDAPEPTSQLPADVDKWCR